MNQLETDLREALHARAARVHASPAVLAADYRPRTRRVGPRLVLGASLATSAGAVAAVLSLTGGAATAFAGWSASPTTPSAGQLAAAQAYCAANVPDPGMPVKLSDSRGPFTITVYSSGATSDFCTYGPSFQNASGWSTSPAVTPAEGKLFLWTDHTATDQGQPYGTTIAQAGPDVSAVNLRLDDGSTVTATVENGWVVAWWPGAGHLASAQLATPTGTKTQTFAAYPCDLDKCGGGPHGGAPGGGPGGG